MGCSGVDATLIWEGASSYNTTLDTLAAAAALGRGELVDRALKSQDRVLLEKESVLGHPLTNAAINEHRKIFSRLIRFFKQNLSPDEFDYICDTALTAAAYNGQAHIVKILLATNLFPPSRVEVHEPALENAASRGHLHILQLIEPKLSPRKFGQHLLRSLLLASRSGRVDAVRFLIDLGADIDAVGAYRSEGGLSALRNTSAYGHAGLVKMLLDAGATPRNRETREASYFALRNGHQEIVKVFLEEGIELDMEGSTSNVFIDMAADGEISMLRFLVNRGIGIREYGHEALRDAAEMGHDHVIALLVSHGVDVNGEEGEDQPILRAMVFGCVSTVKTLEALGADPVDPLQTKYAGSYRRGHYPTKYRPQPRLPGAL